MASDETWEPDAPGYYAGDFDNDDRNCMTCRGEGWVESLAEETGRYFWDTDGPGKCPNCGGTGSAKDQTYW